MIKKGETGKIFENLVVLNINAEFFWRDIYKNEVDVVKPINDKLLPIEIKYSKIVTKAVKLFMKKFKSEKGIILTYDKEKEIDFEGGKIIVIPFYKYFLSAE